MDRIRKIILRLRKYRVWHRWLGLSLAAFLVISAATGILLSLKKDVNLIQPPTQRGIATSLDEWATLDVLKTKALEAFEAAHPQAPGAAVDRMDVRPTKGIVKVLFDKGYWEVQLDGKTAEVLSIERRHSDWIEALHDGSIVSEGFKLLSMNFIGWGLLVMIFTGLVLYFGPRRVRAIKKKL